MTMALVSTVTVGAGGASSIDFTGITSGATDLLLTLSLRNEVGNDKFWIRFNSSTSGYSYRSINGDGSSAYGGSNGDGTDRIASGVGVVQSTTTSTFASSSIYIPNYSGSVAKTLSFEAVGEANSSTAYMDIDGALWNNTAAITSITIFGNNSYSQYSTASLYKITKGSGGATIS